MVRGNGKFLPGGSNGEEADGYKQRREPDHVASSSGSGVLRSWGAKDAGLVWRRWFSPDHGSPYADGNARSGCGALIICAQFFGGLGLVAGLLTRIASLGIAGLMIGAIFMVHLQNGFF